jgi:hypothetical protein
MKGLTVAVIVVAALASATGEQPGRHGGPRLLVLQATAGAVRPAATSSASATGAFILDPEKRTLNYELTYHGLESGNPQSIALHNFGEGGNGPRIYTLCGEGAAACPAAASATITGSVPGTPVDPKLLPEFATGRIYLEIVGGDGRGELRGQLEPNNAMVAVQSFVANLAPRAKGAGTGTAVLSEIHFADGTVAVFYRVTVAGTSGAPQAVALGGVPVQGSPPSFSAKTALPRVRALPSRSAATGGTLVGDYQVAGTSADTPLASRLLARGGTDSTLAITVRTARFPDGELYGVFRQIH